MKDEMKAMFASGRGGSAWSR